MSTEAPFSPTGVTVTLSATTSSSNANISGFPSYNNSGTMRICNAGTVPVFVKWGNGAQTATSADTAILGGSTEVFSVANVTNVAALASTGTATVYVQPGNGQ